MCEYYVHVDCQDLAVSDCKEAATFVASLDKVCNSLELYYCRFTRNSFVRSVLKIRSRGMLARSIPSALSLCWLILSS